MSLADKLRSPRMHSDFYRDCCRGALLFLFILSCVTLLLTLAISWEFLFRKMPEVYYAATLDGQIIPVWPESGHG